MIQNLKNSSKLPSWREYAANVLNAEPQGIELDILNRISPEVKHAYADLVKSVYPGLVVAGKDIANAATLGAVRAIEYVRATIIADEYPGLSWRQVFAIDTSAPFWVDSIRDQFMSASGEMAGLYGDDYVGEDTLVDFDITSAAKPVINTRKAYVYTPLELARATAQGVQLNVEKARLARRAIEERLNDVAWNGAANGNIKGFLTAGQGITPAVVATFNTHVTWAAKLAAGEEDAIIADVQGILNAIPTGSSELYTASQLMLPPARRRLLFQSRMSDSLTETIAGHILNTMPELGGDANNIVGVRELDTAGTGNTALMVAGPGPDSMGAVIDLPQDFTQLDPEVSPVMSRVRCIARTAGVTIKRPLMYAMRYGF